MPWRWMLPWTPAAEAWSSGDRASRLGDGAQVLAADGTPVGPVISLSTFTYPAVPSPAAIKGFGPGQIAVAVDETGRFVSVWSAYNGSGDGDDVFARRFFADGAPIDDQEFIVSDSLAGDQVNPAVAVRAGKMVITWNISSNTSAPMLGQAYAWDNTLRPLGGNFTLPSPGVGNPPPSTKAVSVAIDYQGVNFTVGEYGNQNSSAAFAYFQTFSGLTGLNGVLPGFALQNFSTAGGALLNFSESLSVGSNIGLLSNQGAGPTRWSPTAAGRTAATTTRNSRFSTTCSRPTAISPHSTPSRDSYGFAYGPRRPPAAFPSRKSSSFPRAMHS